MLTTRPSTENYTGPARYNARGILDQPIFYSRYLYHAAHLHHYIRCSGSQDPTLRRLHPLLRRVHCLRRGVAKNMPFLIVGRILQRLGGGGLDVLSEIILTDITSLKERPLYLGLYALPMAGGGVCGPMIGAPFSE